MQTVNDELNREDDSLLDLLDDEVDYSLDEAADTTSEDSDLIALLDEEYEQSEQKNLPGTVLEFAVDIGEHNSFEMDIDFDINEDSGHVELDLSDSEDNTTDLELITAIQAQLADAGYHNLDGYDYEQLISLVELEESLTEDTVEEQRQVLLAQFDSIKGYIVASKATLLKNKIIPAGVDYELSDANGLDKKFVGIICEAINELINETPGEEDITPNMVTNYLINQHVPDGYLSYITNESYDYFLQKAIPAAVAASKAVGIAFRENELQRTKTADYMLREENAAVQAIKSSSYSLIKQIFSRGSSFVYVCSECSKEVELRKDIVSFILYDAEKNDFSSTVIPKLIKCPKCGKEHLLPLLWYVEILQTLRSEYKNGATEIFKFLSKVSKGTAVTKIDPPLELTMSAIQPIIDLNSESDDELVLEPKVSSMYEMIFDDKEYEEAIKLFYNRLLLYNNTDESTTGSFDALDTTLDDELGDIQVASFSILSDKSATAHLSYKELAVCITSELSLDYQTVKNRALFSLIMTLNEYTFMRDSLDNFEYWSLLNQYVILKNVQNVSSNDVGLLEIYRALHQQIFGTDADNFRTMEEKLEALTEYRDNIPQRIKEFQKNQQLVLVMLQYNLDLLAHTKILNINQMNLSLVSRYLNNSALVTFIDEITDKMIINNYAEQFSTVLFKGSVLNNRTIKEILISAVDGEHVINKLSKTLKKIGIVLSDNILSRLQHVSANHLEPLKQAADALKDYEYYRFISSLCELQLCETLIDLNADAQLSQLVKLAHKKKEEIGTRGYLEYYLKDFEIKNLDDLDQSTRAALLHINFGRYVPKKLDGETLTNYICRYQQLSEANAINTVPCYDYSIEFADFSEYMLLIMSGHNALSLGSDNFVLANFMRCLLLMCCEQFSRVDTMYYFGYTEEYFNRLTAMNYYQYKPEYFANVAGFCRVLYGYYMTAAEIFLEPYRNEFELRALDGHSNVERLNVPSVEEIIHKLDSLSDSEIFALEGEFTTVVRKDNTKTVITDVDTEDAPSIREDMLNEIELYVKEVML